MELIFKISPHLLNLIARIERQTGIFDNFKAEIASANDDFLSSTANLLTNLEAPPIADVFHLDMLIRKLSDLSDEDSVELETFIGDFFCKNSICPLRTEKLPFSLINKQSSNPENIFNTIPPFLVRGRLDELLSWFSQELENNKNHPLLVLGCFHLLFLQLSPFSSANHLISCLILQQLLVRYGYLALGYYPIATYFIQHQASYLRALKQAERTANSSWETLNIWLDFFLRAVLENTNLALKQVFKRRNQELLTVTQKEILQTIKALGSATRDQIAQDTGAKPTTVKYNLGVLCERGYLKRIGAGRTTNYQAL